MEQVHMIGIDLAKQDFQLHGARPDGLVVFRKKLTRGKMLGFLASQPRSLVAMEACGSAHYWGREIGKLGYEIRGGEDRRAAGPGHAVPHARFAGAPANAND